jgi:hypothetical protein
VKTVSPQLEMDTGSVMIVTRQRSERDEKVRILRRHLLDRVPVSALEVHADEERNRLSTAVASSPTPAY